MPAPPERDHSGDWLDKVTGITDSHIRGMHLRLPGCGENGPTLEIFEYNSMPEHPSVQPNTPGFSHIAFIVDDVEVKSLEILEHGGSTIGELAIRDLPGVGLLTFQYLADPEGNIVEIQNWKKPN